MRTRTRVLLTACALTLALPARADPTNAEMAGWCVLATALSVVAQNVTDTACVRTRHDLEIRIPNLDTVTVGNVGTASLDDMVISVDLVDERDFGLRGFQFTITGSGAAGDVSTLTARCSIDRSGLIVIGSTETIKHGSDDFGSNFLTSLDEVGTLFYRTGVDHVNKAGFPRSAWDHRMTYERLNSSRGFVEVRHAQLEPEPTVCTIRTRGSVDISGDGFDLNRRILVR